MKLFKIKNVSELKQGQLILTVDHAGYEALEVVACLDNGKIFCESAYARDSISEEDLSDFLENYEAVYVIE